MTNIKNTKRALISSVVSLFLCFAMLLGTTFAWFTDSVSSEGNVIQTGKLKVAFEWADGSEDPASATWTDASEGAIFDYTNWEPGYAEARHLKVSNVGTLALNYQMRIVANGVVSDLADVIDVYYFAEDKALTRDDLAQATYLGTLTEVLGTEKHLSKTVFGSLLAGDPADIHTIVLKMQETAGNEYQDMDLGCTFSVELIASQMASEEDSFDHKYDASAPNPAIPAPLVTEFDNKNISYTKGINIFGEVFEGTLDTAYKFEPTMSEEDVEFSAYKLWHADFVVTADKDVPANSMMLAGYYKEWCKRNNDNWVALFEDTDVAANTEIRLVEKLGTTVNWSEICEFGNDGLGFLCGATDLTGVNAGTTITVELRIYEVGEKGECSIGGGCNHPYMECETGEYITVGTFTYTFEHKADYVAEQLAAGANITLLNDVEFDANTTITIPAGVQSTLDLNGHTISGASSATGSNRNLFTVKGDLTVKNGTVEMAHTGTNMGWGNSVSAFSVEGGELTLDGVTIDNKGGSDMAYGVDVNTTLGTTVLNINNSTIKSTYTAIRVFNNHKTLTGTVNFNSGSVDGARRDIWVQNPSASAVDTNGIVNIASGYTYDVTVQAQSYNGRIYQFN